MKNVKCEACNHRIARYCYRCAHELHTQVEFTERKIKEINI